MRKVLYYNLGAESLFKVSRNSILIIDQKQEPQGIGRNFSEFSGESNVNVSFYLI